MQVSALNELECSEGVLRMCYMYDAPKHHEQITVMTISDTVSWHTTFKIQTAYD